jgi:hypothetical protein
VKIALQISGRLRWTDNSLLSLCGAILEPLQPDVFCSFWLPENNEALLRYIDVCQPKLVEVEDQKLVRPLIDQLFPYNIHANMPSMSYKFYQVAKLRQVYEKQTGILYDLVIQARTDNLFFEKLDQDRCQFSLEKNAILCSNQEYNPIIDDFCYGPRMVDNFYIGPGKLIDKASTTFWRLQGKAAEWTIKGWQHQIRIPEIIQTAIWQDLGISIGGLEGIGSSKNFFYEIDRNDTPWK